MAHEPGISGAHGASNPVADEARGSHDHPTWATYKWVALILTVITVIEVWGYYIPALVSSRIFVPALLVLSALKFAIVVLFYMHLKYDHRLFRALFTGPLVIAFITIISLLFLFGRLALRIGPA